MRPLVSVVVPVYKVEKYIHRCVDSILNQTLENIEIILVDDGSPDSCPTICDEYATKDIRVTVIHKKNGGLASARNAGMAVMSGEYLFFVDSDDWLETDGLQSLYEKAVETGVDFVKYRAIRSFWPGKKEHVPCMVEPVRELEEGLYDKQRIIKEIYPRLFATDQLTMGAVVGAWGALYKTELLQDHRIRFDEKVKYSEDVIFSARVVIAAQSFYFVNTPGVYHYFYNSASISKSLRIDRWASCKALIASCEAEFSDNAEYDFTDELNYLRWFCVLLALNEGKRIKGNVRKCEYYREVLADVKKRYVLSFHNVHVSRNLYCYMLIIRFLILVVPVSRK